MIVMMLWACNDKAPPPPAPIAIAPVTEAGSTRAKPASQAESWFASTAENRSRKSPSASAEPQPKSCRNTALDSKVAQFCKGSEKPCGAVESWSILDATCFSQRIARVKVTNPAMEDTMYVVLEKADTSWKVLGAVYRDMGTSYLEHCLKVDIENAICEQLFD